MQFSIGSSEPDTSDEMRRYRHRQATTAGAGETSEVRGPNSALTEFLKEQGITRRREREQPDQELQALQEDENGIITISGDTSDSSDSSADENDPDVARIRALARRKRRRDFGDSDVSESDPDATEDEGENKGKKNPGQNDTCATCGNLFVVTAFSRAAPRDPTAMGLLCHDCTMEEVAKEKAQKKKDHSLRKQRKKQAEALLDQKQYTIVPKLQDLCISLISTHIDDVEALGEIGQENKNKISRILSRNRRLNSDTMKFFLDASLTKLEFWDCSDIDSDSLRMIGAFCPRLESLTLGMCGRLSADVLLYFGEKLTSLTELYIDGAFLISGKTWDDFFTLVGPRLTSLTIRNSHRISSENVVFMCQHCPNLKVLNMYRLEGVTDSMGYEMAALTLSDLEKVEICYPQAEDVVTDDVIIALCSNVGPQLKELVLDGCSGLTDRILIEGIRPFCPHLQTLSLTNLDQLTDEGIAALFYQWDSSGLVKLCLRRCIALGDNAVNLIVEHSGATLRTLNLNSLAEISLETIESAAKRLPGLEELDIGFCRGINDRSVELLSENCGLLHKIEVYGNPGVTQQCKIREGIRLIGRQSDSI